MLVASVSYVMVMLRGQELRAKSWAPRKSRNTHNKAHLCLSLVLRRMVEKEERAPVCFASVRQ
jgi:hypothetical protein